MQIVKKTVVFISMNARLLFLLPILVTLVQCGSKPGYKDVKFESAKIATPGGHTLSERDYPFDEKGNYRKDWVKSGSTSSRQRQKDAVISAPPALASAPPAPQPQQMPPQSTPSAPTPPQQISLPPARTAPPQTVASTAPAAPQARYHKVVSGDTLFSLSRRYGASVSELKSTNGLTSDTIRLGQTLRVP